MCIRDRLRTPHHGLCSPGSVLRCAHCDVDSLATALPRKVQRQQYKTTAFALNSRNWLLFLCSALRGGLWMARVDWRGSSLE
eukprot:3878972-Alexandrium_andersonii.AAC.1